MRLWLISFTQNGAALCAHLQNGLTALGHRCAGYAVARHASAAGLLPLETSAQEWAGRVFSQADALIFVGAAGIAVRSIAPWLRDKFTDPAVVVVDDQGYFSISLLSGHVGGANALAVEVAGLIGAQPVISTATDGAGLFAVDRWAARNGLYLSDRVAAKRVSAALLDDEPVGFVSDFPIQGELPYGFCADTAVRVGVCVSLDETRRPFDCTLSIVPRVLALGVGCRRGIAPETLEERLQAALESYSISFRGIAEVCTIDLKREEHGLLEFCRRHRLPLRVFSARELAQAEGRFTPSAFVSSITGVDNVCERAAVLGSGGKLVVTKQSGDGVTLALAVRDWSVTF
ncbi:cobalt-precorrin 5A hydrolase [Clostridiaceae bacterium NSJ-31]|uniref:Cobalt-precorrin 5A hydrolase n=1 Tax=Ligaoa zhengdingensis TaxID=2763658 RepID=A0A926DY99_9FIRM|nr:cobalt-precorrin 5A hydrolase [Ligaoa zhengdingensis]MBC8546042.1 cobalt-precorrin 5A hydrolase [Ligaoa zhengdingensis]